MTEVNGELIGGRYRRIELIGQGGMGRVWRGRDETLGRDVAVKEVTFPQGITAEQREVLLQRVTREARAAARLNHPGIITVHDVVEHQGAPVIVMEYVTGISLASLIAQSGGLPVRTVAEIGKKILQALNRAHASGIVHRDLKPDNVLLMDDRVIITDFGIAHMADSTMALTHTGTIIGTPAYMAPEQLAGKTPSAATDLWALGATLYSAVEGQPPFTAETFTALVLAVVTEDPRPALRAGSLGPVLAALLTKDPAQRATAAQAQAALEQAERTGAAVPVPIPTQVDSAPSPAFVPTPDAFTITAPARPSSPPLSHFPPPPAGSPYPQGAIPVGPGTRTLPGPAVARTWRFVGCLALLWITGLALPWNDLADTVRFGYLSLDIVFTLAVALLHALPRPGWHPGACWAAVVVLDTALLFLTKQLVAQLLGMQPEHVTIGFSLAPLPLIFNVLILATGAWLLWWKVPGSRPA
ncbi:serine/threonine-protein kinase [Streptomyces orinoci]|uniref:non-specific serine/threonine protein kinase n=1 Tax=Streptomyces orinoci TaxID=67339 RepID=A0ABV3K4Z2_STRON|nr:serine/threonine-protein kinase [Streptomyces orinoci]